MSEEKIFRVFIADAANSFLKMDRIFEIAFRRFKIELNDFYL